MITLPKFATATLLLLSLACSAVAQIPATTTPRNLVAGVGGPVSASNNWANYSALNLVAGALLFPFDVTSKTTVFYIGFTGGTQADLSNMVLYTTKRGNGKITAVTPVKLKGVSNPMIVLTNKTTCPTQPVSVTNPCVVRLDPIKVTLSTLSDYYLVLYYTDDSNNQSLSAANAQYPITSLTGWYLGGDQTQFKVGDSIPSGYSGSHPFFLLYVMSN